MWYYVLLIFDNSTMILAPCHPVRILVRLFNFNRNVFSSISLEHSFQHVEQSQTKKYKVVEKNEHKINFPLNFLN